MSAKASCPRLFEVEALRDGRLSGAEVRHFRSHLNVCPICASETRALQALAEALRSTVESNGSRRDELHIRRERTRLLAAFDGKLVPAPRNRMKIGLLAAAATVAATITALVLVLWKPHSPAAPTSIASAPIDPVSVHTAQGAKWSRRSDKQLETITLEAGELSIRVSHEGSARRLLVLLPDGELEDVGTTFSVSADSGRTAHVSVSEGSVILRLRGKPPLALHAGESWASTRAPVAEVEEAAPSMPPASQLHARRAAPASPSATKLDGATQLEPDASSDFRAAMAELKAGNNAHAAALFAEFLTRHPRDSRNEDVTYLRVIALQRTRDSKATKQAAAEYLSRYPSGFRKAEVEQLSQ